MNKMSKEICNTDMVDMNHFVILFGVDMNARMQSKMVKIIEAERLSNDAPHNTSPDRNQDQERKTKWKRKTGNGESFKNKSLLE